MTTIQQQASGIVIEAMMRNAPAGQHANVGSCGINARTAAKSPQGVWQAALLDINETARATIKQLPLSYSSADLATVKAQRQNYVGQLEVLQKARKEGRTAPLSELDLRKGIAFTDAILANKTFNPSFIGRTLMVVNAAREHLMPSFATVAKVAVVASIAAMAYAAGSANSGQLSLPSFGNFTIPVFFG